MVTYSEDQFKIGGCKYIKRSVETRASKGGTCTHRLTIKKCLIKVWMSLALDYQ
jgi:hypothetical protein